RAHRLLEGARLLERTGDDRDGRDVHRRYLAPASSVPSARMRLPARNYKGLFAASGRGINIEASGARDSRSLAAIEQRNRRHGPVDLLGCEARDQAAQELALHRPLLEAAYLEAAFDGDAAVTELVDAGDLEVLQDARAELRVSAHRGGLIAHQRE